MDSIDPKKIAEELSDSFDEVVESARAAERERILLQMADYGLREIEHILDRPKWFTVPWAMLHPFRFGKAVGIAEAIKGIHSRSHLLGENK